MAEGLFALACPQPMDGERIWARPVESTIWRCEDVQWR